MDAAQFSLTGVRSAAHNSVFLLGAQAASILIRAVYILILVRWLSPADYGILNYAASCYLAVIALTYLGTDVILGRQIARDRTEAPELLGVTLKLRAYAVLVVAIAFLALGIWGEHDTRIQPLLLILSLALGGRSFWMWCASVFTAFEQTSFVLRIEVIFRTLEVVALVILLLSERANLTAIALVHAASWCFQAAFAFAAVRRRHPIEFRRTRWIAAQIVRDGVPGAIFAIAMASYFSLPVVLFRQVAGTGDELGYFALTFQLIAYIQIIPYTIGSASLPVLSRSAARKDGKDRTATLILIALIPIAGLISAATISWIARPMVVTLFSERYSSAATLFADAVWLIIPMSLAMLLQQLIFSHAIRSPLADGGPIIGVAVMIALFSAMTESMGETGALLAIAIGLVVWLACAATEMFRAGFFRRSKHRSLTVRR